MSATFKRIIIYSSLAGILLAGFFVARQPIVHYASDVITFVKEYSDAHDNLLQTIRQEIFTDPLRANIAGDRANLSPIEIIKLTNQKRADVNADPLVHNVLLDQAATQKLQDMFENQYFEHVSPKGVGPGGLADKVGYTYVVIGENLAMGSFESDEALLDAWMASPGHRENILNTRYTQIGVAVGHGTFNGERVWLAVQEFGKPSNACPSIDATLKTTIDKDKTTVSDLQNQITTSKKHIDTMRHETPEENAAFNDAVNNYNTLVNAYNTQVATLKSEIDTYNLQVRQFNSCAQS